jgi:hypothetical protein
MCFACDEKKSQQTYSENKTHTHTQNESQKKEREGFSMKKKTINCHYKTTYVTNKTLVTGCTAHDKRE